MRFSNGLRVVVVNPCGPEREPLRGLVGTVVRLRREDDLAWVEMDQDLPEGFRVFPERRNWDQQPEPRRNHIMMAPDECEDAARTAAEPAREQENANEKT